VCVPDSRERARFRLVGCLEQRKKRIIFRKTPHQDNSRRCGDILTITVFTTVVQLHFADNTFASLLYPASKTSLAWGLRANDTPDPLPKYSSDSLGRKALIWLEEAKKAHREREYLTANSQVLQPLSRDTFLTPCRLEPHRSGRRLSSGAIGFMISIRCWWRGIVATEITSCLSWFAYASPGRGHPCLIRLMQKRCIDLRGYGLENRRFQTTILNFDTSWDNTQEIITGVSLRILAWTMVSLLVAVPPNLTQGLMPPIRCSVAQNARCLLLGVSFDCSLYWTLWVWHNSAVPRIWVWRFLLSGLVTETTSCQSRFYHPRKRWRRH